MQCRLKCEKPNEILYSMTITMTAGDWEKLRDQLLDSRSFTHYPAYKLIRSIDDLLEQARKIYRPSTDESLEK